MAYRRNPLNALSLTAKVSVATGLALANLLALYVAVVAFVPVKWTALGGVHVSFALAALAICAGAFVMGRAIVRPIARAQDHLERLANGETGFQVRQEGSGVLHALFTAIDTLRQATEKANAGLQMIDNVPTAVMVADPKDDFKITYLNESSRIVLDKIAHLLPVRPDELLGQSVDIFHKNPTHQRRILSNPRNLPYSTVISLGDEKVRLKINAITNINGDYVGPMLCWDIITQQERMEREFDENINAMVSQLSAAFQTMQDQMEGLGRDAQAAVETSDNVSQAAQTTAGNVETVAAAAEELSSSVREISEQMSRSSQMANEAGALSADASSQAEGLSEAADKISEVITMISTIAEQTNLLALNATIEAARAGDAGKGFAVVANEVKSLANQTAQATNDIQSQIEGVQTIATGTVDAVRRVTGQMEQMSQIFASVAAAVEEQSAATLEISGNAQRAAQSTQEVTASMHDVQEAGQRSAEAAGKTLAATQELAQVNETLGDAAADFLKSVKAAAA